MPEILMPEAVILATLIQSHQRNVEGLMIQQGISRHDQMGLEEDVIPLFRLHGTGVPDKDSFGDMLG